MINISNVVVCRLYNKPEGKFYGDKWAGTVIKIDLQASDDKQYLVTRNDGSYIWLHRNEIKTIR